MCVSEKRVPSYHHNNRPHLYDARLVPISYRYHNAYREMNIVASS